MRFGKRLLCLLAALLLMLATVTVASAAKSAITVNAADWPVDEGGAYTSMEEVAVYLTLYGHLPDNFITKKKAEAQGWSSREGNLYQAAPGMSIGGDHFGNYEGSVPDAKGRKWTECDIESDGGYRNGLRIVFSNDGLIYYSDDHYSTFRQVIVTEGASSGKADAASAGLDPEGEYLSRDDVAAYLHAYGQLPANYLTKSQAKKLGWTNKKDNLETVAPGCAIGGDTFGNREGLLPAQKGRTWRECDVNTVDGKRGKERLVWSSDGLIYYSPDNHKSFTQLY